jgi:protein O-mannosyl-transferase
MPVMAEAISSAAATSSGDNRSQSFSIQRSPLWRHPALLALVLIIVTALVYSPVHRHPFSDYDDDAYVSQNDHVKNGLHQGHLTETFHWALTASETGNWLPLTWYSHMLDYRLFGSKAGFHHDVNLLLHLVNVALLFWVLLRATGQTGPSFMVAALFALHPINVESVAWIAERKNLLSMMFFLLALAAWGWYARKPRISRYFVVALLFALGLMSKPQVVTLPFVLLLWDYWPLERMFAGTLSPSEIAQRFPARSFAYLLLEKVPLLALSAASAVIAIWAQKTGGGYNPEPTLSLRFGNAVVSYAGYIGKALWPSHLAVLYPVPRSSLPAWQPVLALLILVAISAAVLRGRQRRYLLMGWLWFLGTLVPMIGLVQVGWQAMADRYAYLSFIGLFIMVCWGLADWARQRQLSPVWLAVPACAALAALTVQTHRQIAYWTDDIALWTHTAQITRGNYIAENHLADALRTAGRLDESQMHLVRAAAINPTYPFVLLKLAVHNQREGKLREAIAQYQQVIAESQRAYYKAPQMMGIAYANMGHAYHQLGDLAKARDSLHLGLALASGDYENWVDLGLVSQQLGDLPAATHAYNQALKLYPFDVGYLLLAQAREKSGDRLGSDWARQQARDLTADYRQAQQQADRLLTQYSPKP